MIKKIFLAAGAVFALIGLSNLALREPFLSSNDFYIMRLLSGRNFFVRSAHQPGSSDTAMELSQESFRMNGAQESFPRDKKAGTFRIFCVGGSTTRGWPFNPRLSYPLLLSAYLKDLLPGRKAEVINAGFCCSDSTSDLPLFKELMSYQPDLVLIYEGRNDVGNMVFHAGYKSRLLEAHVWLLRHVFLYGFLKNKLLSERRFQLDHAKTLRRFMGERNGFDDSALRNLLEKNLRRMIHTGEANHCRVVLLTQALSLNEIRNKTVMVNVNEWIRRLAADCEVGLVDIDGAFRGAGTPYDELVIPRPVHPDLAGYFLMAKTVCERLSEENIIAPEKEWQWGNLKTDGQYLEELDVKDDFLSSVYTGRLGDLLKNNLNNPELAEVYYKKGARILCEVYPGRGERVRNEGQG